MNTQPNEDYPAKSVKSEPILPAKSVDAPELPTIKSILARVFKLGSDSRMGNVNDETFEGLKKRVVKKTLVEVEAIIQREREAAVKEERRKHIKDNPLYCDKCVGIHGLLHDCQALNGDKKT